MKPARVDPAHIDKGAVASIRTDRIDWRLKGMPAASFGTSVGTALDLRLNLFRDGFVGPLVVLDSQALEHNLATMAQWCAAKGVALAPHGKTTMAPQLFTRQLEHGAWAMTAANASQLRVYRAFGVSRVLLANQLLDPPALRWLADELRRDQEFEFSCWVDSPRGVALMTEILLESGTQRPVDVLVELGAHGGRTGARDLPTAVAVAEAVAASPVLRLAGVAGYEGALAHDASADARATVERYLTSLRELTIELARRGLFDGLYHVIVTAGGSAFFDLVADALTAPWPDNLDVLPVLRSGAYITHDDGFYRGISPLGGSPRITGMAPFQPALRAWAQVTSRPTDDLALLTIGKRDASFDEGLPEPQLIRAGRIGGPQPLTGCRVTAMNDQLTFLAIGRSAANTVEVGDWIGFGLSHPCTVFDKWQLIPVVGTDGETVVDLIRTYF
jgi:D-serine deaminase-like pyridoxal phosphate-dependent protein